eukprot:CAMPEP_0184864600 /NCGR_PEP_ID=MMETSP0580-20130426/15575_1 /TAXON_ID=1118495 /ORGANISM="Dactyliosolen fragilissimus" /LENGTH=197 /DNA_ID=CAMNT_0027363473 /DNA_START=159 /DNA_END=752 /DNA_ORIENTATION=+
MNHNYKHNHDNNNNCQTYSSPISITSSTQLEALSRRDALISFTATATLFIAEHPKEANASGGATAGGAYLLSAKQRYNERVLAGVKSYLGLKKGDESIDNDGLVSFFATEDVGGWKDSSAAGYLLANAFRRSSSTPPDSLPSVKKWKAFASELEGLQKSLKKKDSKNATKSYVNSLALLDAYLEAVELPPVIEIQQQ